MRQTIENSFGESVWKRLQKKDITSREEALQFLVDVKGNVHLEQLDSDLSDRFFSKFRDRSTIPHVIPLLLWKGELDIGSPITLSNKQKEVILHNVGAKTVNIIPITEDSYIRWFRRQRPLDPNTIDSSQLINPLTGEIDQADIGETTDFYLSQAVDQTRRINAIISIALQHRASDIHLEPTPTGLRVRFRIDGILRDIKVLPLEISRKIIVALKVMSDMDIADSRRPQDGRIGKEYTNDESLDSKLDMRVSTLPCVGGEKAVIRLLPRDNPFSNHMESLGFSDRALKIYESWLHQPQGLIIMTGPTGSGKTSTLYTSLQAIAQEHVNVITVEDPVEYVLPNITQTQVCDPAGMTFAAGLRAILRQDPDIVMVGEIRDPETAETVIRAALTGHLVLSTMHTNDAASAIPRLKDLGPDPGLISDALLGVVAQRLVRKNCPYCSVSHYPSLSELQALKLDREDTHNSWRKGKGCERCFFSGYIGREAIIELIDIDDAFRQMIYEGTISQMNRYLNWTLDKIEAKKDRD
jgi:type II secretory ATPase GspE/PulE/Tfp pilus assembly ATPase PilB-like protein